MLFLMCFHSLIISYVIGISTRIYFSMGELKDSMKKIQKRRTLL
jgi:hypothetical protein